MPEKATEGPHPFLSPAQVENQELSPTEVAPEGIIPSARGAATLLRMLARLDAQEATIRALSTGLAQGSDALRNVITRSQLAPIVEGMANAWAVTGNGIGPNATQHERQAARNGIEVLREKIIELTALVEEE